MRRSARTVLLDARSLIGRPSKWCRGWYVAGRYGDRIDASEAMHLALGYDYDDKDEHPATKALREVTPKRYERLSDFNDTHSHREVMDLFAKAIRRASR